MPTTRVSRTLAADPEAVWAVLADPHHQPRWWPRVRRMEGVEADRFTQVLATERGKGVRADFVLLERESPRLRWAQELDGTPFERLLVEAETTIAIDPAPGDEGGTRVEIVLRQRLRGWSRMVPFLFKRAAQRQLGEALEGLAGAVER